MFDQLRFISEDRDDCHLDPWTHVRMSKKHRLVQATPTRSSKASQLCTQKDGWPGKHRGGCSTMHRVDQPHLGVQSTITNLNFQPTSGGNLEHWGAKATYPLVDRHGKVPSPQGLSYITINRSVAPFLKTHKGTVYCALARQP